MKLSNNKSASCLKIIPRFILILGIGFVALLLVAETALTAMGGLLIIADPLRKSDAVVLLSGGEPSRMEEAIRLFEDKYAGYIILTETGATLPGFEDIRYSKEQKLALIDRGIPNNAIEVTEAKVSSTLDEADVVKHLLLKNDSHSVIIVTDPFHTFRTRLVYRHVFKGSGLEVSVRPARTHWYKSTTWWMSADGWRVTLEEYAKLIGYLLEYGLR